MEAQHPQDTEIIFIDRRLNKLFSAEPNEDGTHDITVHDQESFERETHTGVVLKLNTEFTESAYTIWDKSKEALHDSKKIGVAATVIFSGVALGVMAVRRRKNK